MMLTQIQQKYNIATSFAGVAQLVERRTENPYVASPILAAGKVRPLYIKGLFFILIQLLITIPIILNKKMAAKDYNFFSRHSVYCLPIAVYQRFKLSTVSSSESSV